MVSSGIRALSRTLSLPSSASLKTVPEIAAATTAFLNISRTNALPATIHTTATLRFSRPVFNANSTFFAHWRAKSTSLTEAYDSLIAKFDKNSQIKSAQGVSAAQIASFSAQQIIFNIAPIIESFFPLDPPNKQENAQFLAGDFVQAFRQNQGAKDYQQALFLTIASALGIMHQNNKLMLKPDFKAKDCALLATPNGRSALAQLIRSMDILGNQDMAKQFQVILLAIARRYNLPDHKMRDIALATSTNFWPEPELTETPEQISRVINTILWQPPPHSMINLAKSQEIEARFLASTGNGVADFLLGHSSNTEGLHLTSMLKTMDEQQLFIANSRLIKQLFPTQAEGLATDAQRCFAKNPLLRYSHRQITNMVLEFFHLYPIDNKVIIDVPMAKSRQIGWLLAEHSEHRQVLIRILKSLYYLGNHSLALNLKTCILEHLKLYRLDHTDVENAIPNTKPALHKNKKIKEIIKPATSAIEAYLEKDESHNLLLELKKLPSMGLNSEELKTLLNTKSSQGMPLLVKAVVDNKAQPELLQSLLACIALLDNAEDKKALLYASTQHGHTPIFLASNLGYTDAIQALLSMAQKIGDNFFVEYINKPSKTHKITALSLAIMNKHKDCANVILNTVAALPKTEDKLAILSAKGLTGNTPIWHAASRGQTELLSKLIEIANDFSPEQCLTLIEAKNNNDVSALAIAAEHGYQHCLRLFIANMLQFDKETQLRLIDSINPVHRCSPICEAASRGQTEAVIALFSFFNLLDSKTQDKLLETKEAKAFQAMLFAIKNAKIFTFQSIVEMKDLLTPSQQKKFLSLTDKTGSNAIMLAAQAGIPETVKDDVVKAALKATEVLSANAQYQLLSAKDLEQKSALSLAAEKGNSQALQAIVEAIFKVNARHQAELEKLKQAANDATDASIEAYEKRAREVQEELYLLLESKNAAGLTALQIAKRHKHSDCIYVLTQAVNRAALSEPHKKSLLTS